MPSPSRLEKYLKMAEFRLPIKQELIDKMARRSDLNEDQKIFIGGEKQDIQIISGLVEAYKQGLDKELGKLPPQDTEMEEAVLGAVMLEAGAIEKLSFLKPEHFYWEKNQHIWRACRGLLLNGHPIDMRTVVMALRKAGKIEEVGGAYYIAELTSKVSSAANIEAHARFVLEMAIKRRLIEMAGHIMNAGYDDTKDVFVMLDEAEEEFKVVNSWIVK